jgi:hypothetical protein
VTQIEGHLAMLPPRGFGLPAKGLPVRPYYQPLFRYFIAGESFLDNLINFEIHSRFVVIRHPSPILATRA